MFGNESPPLTSFMGTKVPGNEGSWERTKVPMELSPKVYYVRKLQLAHNLQHTIIRK